MTCALEGRGDAHGEHEKAEAGYWGAVSTRRGFPPEAGNEAWTDCPLGPPAAASDTLVADVASRAERECLFVAGRLLVWGSLFQHSQGTKPVWGRGAQQVLGVNSSCLWKAWWLKLTGALEPGVRRNGRTREPPFGWGQLNDSLTEAQESMLWTRPASRAEWSFLQRGATGMSTRRAALARVGKKLLE